MRFIAKVASDEWIKEVGDFEKLNCMQAIGLYALTRSKNTFAVLKFMIQSFDYPYLLILGAFIGFSVAE